DRLEGLTGEGEGDALDGLPALVAAHDRGGDPDQLAGERYQRAAAVAVVDGSVGLDQILHHGIVAGPATVQAAGDATGDVVAEVGGAGAEGDAADRQHLLAVHERVRVAELDRAEAIRLDADHGDIGEGRIVAHEHARPLLAAGELDRDLGGAVDDVLIG